MPRNGSGVASPPAGTTAQPNTTIKSAPYNAMVSDVYQLFNDPTPITAGGTGAETLLDAQANLSVDNKVTYAAKAATYTAVASDNNAVHRFTSAVTVALTAAATLGANWHYTVIAGADVTIDPNGTETINGVATLLIPNGMTAEIICDGSNFFTVFKPMAWEVIGSFTASAVSAIAVTNLSAFRTLRITGSLSMSSTAVLSLQTSTNNGSSYDSGVSDYSTQVLGAFGTGVTTALTASGSFLLTPSGGIDANTNSQINAVIDLFNVATQCKIDNNFHGILSSTLSMARTSGQRSQSTARNAFRIAPGAGTLSGKVIVEGIRG